MSLNLINFVRFSFLFIVAKILDNDVLGCSTAKNSVGVAHD
jgi:hypothetical protein